jgi:hypothetical protein
VHTTPACSVADVSRGNLVSVYRKRPARGLPCLQITLCKKHAMKMGKVLRRQSSEYARRVRTLLESKFEKFSWLPTRPHSLRPPKIEPDLIAATFPSRSPGDQYRPSAEKAFPAIKLIILRPMMNGMQSVNALEPAPRICPQEDCSQ